MQETLDRYYMKQAITKALVGVQKGELPFGACLVCDGELVAIAHNSVLHDHDVTAHAELQALHIAWHKLGRHDLSGATLYTTSEPCQMCLAAALSCGVTRIVFGTNQKELSAYGFEPDKSLKRRASSPAVNFVPGFLHDECYRVFEHWASKRVSK